MNRCVSHYVKKGRDQKQAVAICYSQWRGGDEALGDDAMFMDESITVDAADVRRTPDGYLVAMPRIARTGIQLYAGKEVGRPDLEKVRVYRPADEVFSDEAMRSYAHRPVTMGHPVEAVTSRSYRRSNVVGHLDGEVHRDGSFVRVPLVLMDQVAIDAFEAGKRELSNGYTCDLKWEPGKTEDGEEYDAVQRCIRGNHLAIVTAARGGRDLRIGDEQKGDRPMKIITVDGVSCEMDEQSAQVVDRAISERQTQLDNASKGYAALEEENKRKKKQIEEDSAAHVTALAQKDAEIATLRAQLADAKMTPAKLDQMVRDRDDLVGKARTVLGDKLVVDGKTDAEIRRQVVDAHPGLQGLTKDWTDDQVAISYATLTADVKPAAGVGTAVAAAAHIIGGASRTAVVDERQKAWDEKRERIANAHLQKPAA